MTIDKEKERMLTSFKGEKVLKRKRLALIAFVLLFIGLSFIFEAKAEDTDLLDRLDKLNIDRVVRDLKKSDSKALEQEEENRLIIKFKDGLSKRSPSGISAIRAGVGENRNQESWIIEEGSREEVIAVLKKSDQVEYVFPEELGRVVPLSLEEQFNDSFVGLQWGLEQVKLGEAMEMVKREGITLSPVTIIIVDDGVWPLHEDLENLVEKRIYCSEGGCQEEENDNVVAGTHGTHVGGIAGALVNNEKGVASPNLQNKFKLVSIRVFDSLGKSVGILNALQYLIDNFGNQSNVVVNLSLGTCLDNSDLSEEERQEFIQYEQQLYNQIWNKGMLVVASAGNSGNAPDNEVCFQANSRTYPASLENVISVGALSPEGTKAPYSQYGDWVDLTAPGGDQAVCWETSGLTDEEVKHWKEVCQGNKDFSSECKNIWDKIQIYFVCLIQRGVLSTVAPVEDYEANSYDSFEGTSMSAPLVSGIAALVWSINPSLTNAEVRDILFTTAEKIDHTGEYWHYGRVDAYEAVKAAIESRLGGSGGITTATPTPISVTPTLTPEARCQQFCSKKTFIKGDANCDGKINNADYQVWLNQFDKAVYEWAELENLADFDCNGKVDLSDFELWRRNAL